MVMTNSDLRLEVAGKLGDTGYEWSQSETQNDRWQTAVNDRRGRRCELTATIVEGGVEIATMIAEWEKELSAACSAAFPQFLEVAQRRIPAVLLDLQGRRVRCDSFVAHDRLDIELRQSIASVVAVSELLGRELDALGNEAIARAYLDSFESPRLG